MQAATHERGLGWRDEYIDRVEATCWYVPLGFRGLFDKCKSGRLNKPSTSSTGTLDILDS